MESGTDINLNKIEKRAWSLYFEDGFWDMFLGLLMLSMGISQLTDGHLAGYLLMGFAVVLGPVGRMTLTYPRVGKARFGPVRRRNRRKMIIIISICVVLGLIGFILGAVGLKPPEDAPDILFALGFGALFLGVFTSLAWFLEFPRLYIYAVLFALSIALTEGLENSTGPVMLCAFGGMVVMTGVFLLVRFLRRYPRMTMEAKNE